MHPTPLWAFVPVIKLVCEGRVTVVSDVSGYQRKTIGVLRCTHRTKMIATDFLQDRCPLALWVWDPVTSRHFSLLSKKIFGELNIFYSKAFLWCLLGFIVRQAEILEMIGS